MVLISIGSLIFFVLLLYLYARISLSLSLVIVSCFSICTFSGVVSSSGFIFYLFSIIIFVLFNRISFKKDLLILFFMFLLFLLPILFLSLNNGASEVKSFLKFFQSVVAIFGLVFISRANISISQVQMERICISFIVVNVVFGLVFHLLFNVYDLGLIRFSGIFFDSNYYGLYCLLLYFSLDLFFKINRLLKLILALMVLSSLSFSILLIFVMYIILSQKCPKFLMNPFAFFSALVSSMICYLTLMLAMKKLSNEAVSNQFIFYKLSSLSHRLSAQFDALDILTLKHAFFSGMGSGRNLELTGRALHHSFLQMIFSHGIIYYLLMISILTLSLKGLDNTLLITRKYYAIFYCLLVACFVLDPYATLFFNIVALLFYAIKSNTVLARG
ncbi:hypothetical protein L2747_04220 [Shewanella marinintestina]|uniref:hypothetical protein n=1 Tax=Shewanella marinintestina TaxID=190305 RepID=UPI00200D6861|nr:hypothetical protein [Shewanella marinintestina]MCL1145221.1 hypothetical protein [Shewanella marinintestina]